MPAKLDRQGELEGRRSRYVDNTRRRVTVEEQYAARPGVLAGAGVLAAREAAPGRGALSSDRADAQFDADAAAGAELFDPESFAPESFEPASLEPEEAGTLLPLRESVL